MPEPEKHWTLLGTKVGLIANGPDIPVGESVEVVPVSSLDELREGIDWLATKLENEAGARDRLGSLAPLRTPSGILRESARELRCLLPDAGEESGG